MQLIAAFMQNQTAVIALGVAGMIVGVIGLIILGVVAAAAFLHRLPGALFSLVGASVILSMFTFATFLTITMELQYGPAGVVVQNSVYAIGGFLCVLGYARLIWWAIRNRRVGLEGMDGPMAAAGK